MARKKQHKDTPVAARLRKDLQQITSDMMKTKKKIESYRISTKVDGKLRIQNTPSGPQYFHVTCSNENPGRYLSRKHPENLRLAENLAQQDYLAHMKRLTDQWISGLARVEKAIDMLPESLPQNLYADNLPRRQLITPVSLSDAEYTAQWLSVRYKGKGFAPDTPVIKTNKGERVRSKSEKIIADRLNELQIPYRYEYPLNLAVQRTYTGELDDGTEVSVQKQKTVTFYPDFTLLSPDRTEIILEHFGLMDDASYKSSFVGKLRIYAENGFFPGNNLIISVETADVPLDTAILEATIRDCFLRHQ